MNIIDKERLVENFIDRCREQGIRVTHQRLEIFRELAVSEEHPSADIIFERVRERLPTVSLDTIYRTLNLFEKKGIISKVGLAGERARFDAVVEPHHHFVCSMCGCICDVTSSAFGDITIPPEIASMGTVESVNVVINGLCSTCREQRKQRETS